MCIRDRVGTEKAWNSCKEFGVPKFFLINKTDKENVDVDKTIDELKSKFGTSVVTLDDKDALTEAIEMCIRDRDSTGVRVFLRTGIHRV